jgi:hypothetical protein
MKKWTRSRALHVGLLAALALAAATTMGASSAFADGDYGPDTCLNGWVWREVVPTDHVCVTTDERRQVALDNAQAAARRNPAGGPYGPDTCFSPFVWREAIPGDHVCVVTQERARARYDNLNANSRRNDLRISIGTYRPNPVTCNGDVCSTTNDDAARYSVHVDRINTGSAYIGLYRASDRAWLWGKWVSVPANPSAPGGLLDYNTPKLQCSRGVSAYFRVKDGASGRWSSRVPVITGCYTL